MADLKDVAKSALGSAGFGSIASAGLSLIGGLVQSSNQSKIIKAQQRENELNRKFNAQQAQLSRDYNTAMWNSQNQYNSPSAVLKRLQDAGINPALAYGSIADSANFAQSPTASSSGSVSSQLIDGGFSGAATAMANYDLTKAQARLAEAQAKKVSAEIPWVDKLNESTIKQATSLIGLTDVQKTQIEELTPLQKEQLQKTVDNIEASTDQLRQLTSHEKVKELLTGSQKTYQDIINKYADDQQKQALREGEARIKQLFANTKLADVNAELISQTMVYAVSMAEDNAFITQVQAAKQAGEAHYFGKGANGEPLYNPYDIPEKYRDMHGAITSGGFERMSMPERVALLQTQAYGNDMQKAQLYLQALGICLGTVSSIAGKIH